MGYKLQIGEVRTKHKILVNESREKKKSVI
jgi:hypothetical protein